jgi:hypothetical protein
MNIRRGLFRVWAAASIAWAAPVGYLTMQSALDKWSLYVSSQQKDLRDGLELGMSAYWSRSGGKRTRNAHHEPFSP